MAIWKPNIIMRFKIFIYLILVLHYANQDNCSCLHIQSLCIQRCCLFLPFKLSPLFNHHTRAGCSIAGDRTLSHKKSQISKYDYCKFYRHLYYIFKSEFFKLYKVSKQCVPFSEHLSQISRLRKTRDLNVVENPPHRSDTLPSQGLFFSNFRTAMQSRRFCPNVTWWLSHAPRMVSFPDLDSRSSSFFDLITPPSS